MRTVLTCVAISALVLTISWGQGKPNIRQGQGSHH